MRNRSSARALPHATTMIYHGHCAATQQFARGCLTIRIMGSGFPDTVHAVTFDCCSTLIYEAAAPDDSAERKLSGTARMATLRALQLMAAGLRAA